MYQPYGPYVGCTDGALDYVDTLLDWADSYGLSVLIDVHTAKDSQNGFDNSGQSLGFQWTSGLNKYPRGLTTFQHWPIREVCAILFFVFAPSLSPLRSTYRPTGLETLILSPSNTLPSTARTSNIR